MTQLADQMAQLRPAPSRALVSVLNAAGGLDVRGGRKGFSALLGPVDAQLALSVFSLLPWLCAHFRYSMHSSLAALSILVRPRSASLGLAHHGRAGRRCCITGRAVMHACVCWHVCCMQSVRSLRPLSLEPEMIVGDEISAASSAAVCAPCSPLSLFSLGWARAVKQQTQ